MISKNINNNKKEYFSINNNIFIIVLFIVFILPWAHGGEVFWQYLIFCSFTFSLGAIYFINNTSYNSIALKSVKKPLISLSIWLLFQVIQVIPLPIDLTINSSLNLSHIVEKNLVPDTWHTISIAPNITLIEIIKHTSYVTIFILTLLLINTKRRVLSMANTLFFSSAIIALYSLINHYTQGEFSFINSIPPWTKTWEKAAHGTFSYQNHYASFLTLTIPLVYGLIYANRSNKATHIIETNNTERIIRLLISLNGLYLLSSLIMIVALFKTVSRGGNTIFIIAVAITFLCVLFQQKKSKKEKLKKLGFGIMSIIIISGVIISTGITDSLTKRLNSQGYAPSGRDLMYNTAFAIIQKRPLVGTGAGTYPVLQHKYKDPKLGITPMSKRAHNDYLELIANQGLIGFSLLGFSTLLLTITLFKKLQQSTKNKTKKLYGLQVASLCSVIAILLHSLVDFNFHLPVNAVYFYLILAIGLKIPLLR
jgi:O-antigen ligase